ncbi:uncharacterized protein C17orf114-like [Polyodon spathula]|uniref:uncharacterized protein C17orf114-like n=1 Tax=Polyodon spathula TaxID=7913 RepID=UPI001B7F18FA|nr:uncharacterized protein C17orf114-like [Polyodon spathula]XP_041093365.1 uncharacterized protein C17orf114-like [Polyodon spathula]XP_041093366.1 uncharacterized protein C17orf114-like [Polyodon spathula]
MGGKGLHCFPWYSRWKERSKEAGQKKMCEQAAGKTRLPLTQSVSSEGDSQSQRAYFSRKAHLSFRHEMDSPVAIIDSTN